MFLFCSLLKVVNYHTFLNKSIFSFFMTHNIIITGVPKSGKSTLMHSLLPEEKKTGFITKEILQNNRRTGFQVITSTNNKQLLASTKINSSINVGRFGVDIDGFDNTISSLFTFHDELLYIDEVGHMQLYSQQFQKLVNSYLDAPNLFIGTMSSIYDHKLIDQIKTRKDTTIHYLTADSRKDITLDIEDKIIDYFF